MKILVTGTPGVGKTTLSRHMCEKTKMPVINVGDFIEKNLLYSRTSRKYRAMVYSPKRVETALKKELGGMEGFIVDTHDPEVVSFVNFDLIVVLRMDRKVLGERYEERRYPEVKISENLEAEIMEVVYNDAIAHLCKSDDDVREKILLVEGSEGGSVLSVEEVYAKIEDKLGVWQA